MKNRALAWLLIVLLLNTAYVAAFAHPTIFYMSQVVLHLVLGVLFAVGALWLYRREAGPIRTNLLRLSLLTGLALVVLGNTFPNRWILWSHIAISFLFLAALAPWIWRTASIPSFRQGFAVALAVLILFPAGAMVYRKVFPNPHDRIVNPLVVPASMEEEGGGPKTPFWPSSSRTNVGGTIPSNFFMDSDVCGSCHKDIYEQWKSSVHHFASFNNQFYRKAIEHMQSVKGTQASKWCAGCHDHAVFFNGRFEKPIKDQIDSPEAQNGLGCVSCHSITHVDSTMGNGGFTIEYPKLHDLASSKNPWIRKADSFLTYLDPEPHKKTFLKPFMVNSSEFCSTCHKVHLDVPVNDYRWLRGFNDYDNWQASGVSGQGARSFYYPAQPLACAGCHMPMVQSKDPGNRNGLVHSHRFAAANMAVAYANQDKAQMEAVEKNLKSGFMSVDIFAASPVDEGPGQTEMKRRAVEGPQLSTSFAVGEEAESAGQVLIREVGKIAAPIDRAAIRFHPGSTVRVDVVVRTKRIGHFFPGGTVDSFDTWLELEGKDASGRHVFWSGCLEDGDKGPVEPGAHFYRSYQLDADGNPINKRNAWQTRSTLYVRLIPPGAADVAHYRVHIPKDAQGPITLRARLNYRKFSHYYTQFAYSGEPKPGQDPALVSASFDNREYTFGKQNIPANVSGVIKDRVPDLPVVTIAQSEARLNLGDAESAIEWKPVAVKEDRERWNDWGIGLLLQGDLKGAEYAFTKVTEIDPKYADGWLNVARALIQEGETERAKPFIETAMKIDSSLGRIYFFKAMAQKADGDYDGALQSLRTVVSKYPRDRVALNQIGRILFLKKEYPESVAALQRVLGVDPEDLQAHYTLMLAYRGLGDTEKAAREENLFRRFKADESSQTITASRRMSSPEDNNERQTIHDHESVPLTSPSKGKPAMVTRTSPPAPGPSGGR
jgi:tetratricopeptide (TPR) repeat protein